MAGTEAFGLKMIKYGEAMANVNRKAVTAAAMVYKGSLLASGAKFTGGDLRFSRWKGGLGPKMGAGFDVSGTVKAEALLRVRPYGLWLFLEQGGRDHDIINKSKRRGGKKSLHIGEGFPMRVHVRGRKGTYAFSLGANAGQPGAIQAYKRTQIIALAEAN
jgi:hypothetical protein